MGPWKNQCPIDPDYLGPRPVLVLMKPLPFASWQESGLAGMSVIVPVGKFPLSNLLLKASRRSMQPLVLIVAPLALLMHKPPANVVPALTSRTPQQFLRSLTRVGLSLVSPVQL